MDFIEHDSLVPFCRHAEVVFVEYGALALLDDSPGVGIVPAEVQIPNGFADSRLAHLPWSGKKDHLPVGLEMRIRHGFVEARILSGVHAEYCTIFIAPQSIPKRIIFRFGITKAEYAPLWKREF